ncbi:MAG: alkaline phosphatase family protein [Gemmatimonadaceae bacterium]
MAVIVLLADGLRTDTLRRALDDGALPAIARLLQRGGLYEVSSAFPSVTGPAYTPFLLGRFPGPVGMPGLRWFDRSRRVCVFPNARSYVGHEMRAANMDLDASAPTIFELVPDSAAAMTIITRGLPRRGRLMSLSTRTALRAALTHFGGRVERWLDVDRETSATLVRRVRDAHPSFVFAAFMGVDKISHARGQDDATIVDALRIVDDTVKALEAERDPNATRIWLASDHGHSPVTRHDDLQLMLTARGLRAMAHPWVYGPADVAVMVSGNAMAHLYVGLRQRQRPFWTSLASRWSAVVHWLLTRESVDLLMLPVDSTTCTVWSRNGGHADVGWSASGFSYHMRDGDPLAVGRDLHNVSASAAHEATIGTDHPDSVVQIAKLASSERCGDIILSATRGWDFRERYEPIPHVSSHGALHRDHMFVPLLLDTPPARPPRRTADVMPSALTALGVPIPDGLDGESFV